MYRYNSLLIITLLIILITGYSCSTNFRDSNLSKGLIVKYYNSEDCSGEVTLIRVLLDSNNYCFSFPIPTRFQIISSGHQHQIVRLSNCKDCSINDGLCGFNLTVNQCIKGVKLFNQQLDYDEGDYCIATETDNLSKDIFDFKLKGFSAYRKNHLVNHLQVIVKCDYQIFNVSHATLPYFIEFKNVYPSFGQSLVDDIYLMVTQDPDFLTKRNYYKEINNYWEQYFIINQHKY